MWAFQISIFWTNNLNNLNNLNIHNSIYQFIHTVQYVVVEYVIHRVWWCAVVRFSPLTLSTSGIYDPVGHSQDRSIVEGQIERDSVECLEYDDEFCCGSDADDGRPLARWLHFGSRHRSPPQPRHSVLDDDEQLLVEGILLPI